MGKYFGFILKEIMLLKCPYDPKLSIDLMQSLLNANDISQRYKKNMLAFVWKYKRC